MMTHPRVVDVLRETGVPDLVEILAERLSPPELEAVLREAHWQRALRIGPDAVLSHYEQDPSVRPSRVGAATLAAVDRIALAVAAPPFEPLELSPICPAGAVAAPTLADPGAAQGVAGSAEVVSDCTAILALEAAFRRRAAVAYDGVVRLCASHRELHVPFSAPLRSDPHTRVFALCTAGADEGGLQFEIRNLREHLEVHLRLLQVLREEGYRIGGITVTLAHEHGVELDDALPALVAAPLAAAFPAVRFVMNGAPARHYTPVGFTVAAEDRAEVEHQIALGGCTDWTRRLLGRDDERLFVSRIATERLCEAFGSGGAAAERGSTEQAPVRF